jgi:hypothetical protein
LPDLRLAIDDLETEQIIELIQCQHLLFIADTDVPLIIARGLGRSAHDRTFSTIGPGFVMTLEFERIRQ